MSVSIHKLKNGRSIAVNDFGNRQGFPIIVNHGLIASIKDEHYFSMLLDAGYRVICIARPGYGASSPIELKNIRSWGTIVKEIVREIGINKFDISGLSSGT